LQQGFLETAAYVNTTSNHKLSTNQTTVLIINIKNIKFVVSLVESRFCSHHITSHHIINHFIHQEPPQNSTAKLTARLLVTMMKSLVFWISR